MYLNLKTHSSLLIALLAGSLLPLAFAPHHIWFLGLLSPTILLFLWNSASPKSALQLGFGFGLGLFGMGVSWVYISIHDYGNTEAPLAVFITTLFVLILSLYPALQGYVLKKMYKQPNAALWLVGFPSSWVLFEWLRGWLFSGFPWLYLGYTQIDTPLGNYAPLLSVYGISWIIGIHAGCILSLIYGKGRIKTLAIVLLVLLWGVGYILKAHGWTTATGPLQTVSLVQGNVDPLHKFAQSDPIEATEALYGALTEKAWGKNLIVWPENAVPIPLPYANHYLDKLNEKAKQSNSTLITGIQQIVQDNEYYNSIIAVGLGSGIYHKRHLVPFGEFLPFDRWLRGLIHFFDIPMSNFTEGPPNQPLLHAFALTITPLICYEIAYPELVRSAVSKAELMVNISEDGWFGKSWGPHQHLEIARMRAKETGRPLLRATTSGISAIIDDRGNIIARSPQFEALVLSGTIQGTTGDTPWVRFGLWPLLSTLLGIFMLGVYINSSAHRYVSNSKCQ